MTGAARRLAILLAAPIVLAAGALPARAHVGSPDTWYQGNAGPYPVRVIVRAPGVVPGLAEISVRVLAGRPARVSVRPFIWNAGPQGAPPADEAAPVRGDPELYSVQLWFMAPGSYAVHVRIDGDRGTGVAIVPVQAVATRRLPMERAMGWILVALGLFLCAGMVTFVRAALRDSVVPPGEIPDRRRRRDGRVGAIVTALVLVLALTGGWRWWSNVDREYRANLDRPLHVSGHVVADGRGKVLRLALDDPKWTRRRWSAFVPDHGKLMHLFLVREPAMDAMAHLHPLMRDTAHFDVRLPDLPPGRYRAYADVVHESGYLWTFTDTVDVPANRVATDPAVAGVTPDPDDSWLIGATAVDAGAASRFTFADGSYLVFDRGPEPLVAGRDRPLAFEVHRPDGTPARLEPYLGMPAHAVVLREDGSVFAHLHPIGTVSMASEMALAMRTPADSLPGSLARRMVAMGDMPGHAMSPGFETPGRFTIPYGFPRAGRYRVWVQVRLGGLVRTAAFAVEVAGETRQAR